MLTSKTSNNYIDGSIANANRIINKKRNISTDNLLSIQTKLTIGQPGDRYEQEADRVADRVLTMSEPAGIQRACSKCNERELQTKPEFPNITPLLQRIPEEEKEETSLAQRAPEEEEEPVQTKTDSHTAAPSVESSINIRKGQGVPLQDGTRSFMESRFGSDFGNVRVHNDNNAAQLNRQLNAQAFTKDSDIYFNQGKYNPESTSGKHLLAHELTHVIQQNGVKQDSIQRSCGSRAIGTPSGCTVPADYGSFRSGTPYRFRASCDEFEPGEGGALVADARALPPGTTVTVHGYASVDGDPTFNHNLACSRALAAVDLLTLPGPVGAGLSSSQITAVNNHGPTPGPARDMRSVTIEAASQPEIIPPKCGPDATQWFIDQMNTAISDSDVLYVQSEMAAADAIARRYGITARQVAETGTVAKVLAEEAKLNYAGSAPPRTADANRQILAGALSTVAVTRALSGHPIDSALILNHIYNAGTRWASLVNHGARYDFKAHSSQMNFPSAGGCPEEACPPGEVGIITLCPGTLPENCYQSDLPGNLFYSRIGQFAGFSELTLQLGSQYAELTDTTSRPSRPTVTWDSPEDTLAIAIASVLPLPLTRSTLCAILALFRSGLSIRTGCQDCTVASTAVVS